MADRMRRILSCLERYAIVVGEAAHDPRFKRIDLCISVRGMEIVKALDGDKDIRVYGNEDRGSINTPIPIYLWGDGDEPSRYLRLAMGLSEAVVLFGVKMRSYPHEPAKPIRKDAHA
jgi:hypothetical protein